MTDYNIKTRVVGVDISNECTTYAVVDIRGNIIAKDSFKTSLYPDASQFAARLTESILLLAEANGGFEAIRSLGISSPSALCCAYSRMPRKLCLRGRPRAIAAGRGCGPRTPIGGCLEDQIIFI